MAAPFHYDLSNSCKDSLDLGNDEFRGNAFRGSIPTAVGLLNDLTGLELHNIRLTGTIPTEIGRLTKLGGVFSGYVGLRAMPCSHRLHLSCIR
jgi:hypothetical protein